jgi:hypothetical protein
MAHRIAHPARGAGTADHNGAPDNGAPHNGALTRIQSAVIFGSIGSGLLACALGAFIYDIVAVVAGR